MGVRIGDVLVGLGALEEWQRETIAAAQASSGRPFGALAEEMFGVSPRIVEQAWAVQYARIAGTVDLDQERTDPDTIPLVDRRQAWQFQILPLRLERGVLVMATTLDHLAKAMRFAGWALAGEVTFLIAEPEQLLQKLGAAYPMPGGLAVLDEARKSA